MAERLGPPPKKADERFDNWVFRLWKRAFGALNSGDVGVTAPIVVATSGTGTLNIGHGTSGVTSGTYGSASVIPQVVVDTYGHVTSVGTNAVAISGTSVTGTDLTFTSPILGTATNAVLRGGTIAHATSGVIPGTYGNQSSVPIVAVNTWGHVTLATSSAIAINGTAVTGTDVTFNSPILGTLTNAVLRVGAISHATSGIVAGTYGSVSIIPQVVVNTWGHVTAINTFGLTGTAVSGADISLTSPIEFASGTGTNAVLRAVSIRHSTSGIVPGTFGGASVVPQVVVNTYGHVTAVNTLNIAVDGTAVTGANLTVNSPLQGTVTNALLRAGAISHAVSGVVASTYGGALGLARVIVDTYGHITAGTSFPLQATAPILVGSNAGTFTWGHSTSGIVPGTFGAATIIPQVVVNTYGHVTAVNTFALTGTAVAGADVSVTSPITISGTSTNAVLRPFTIAHATSGIVPGTFGDASTVPQIVVNTYGHVTAVNTFAVSAGELSNLITGGTTTMGTRGSRVYAHELTLGTDGGMVIPSTAYLVITG